jgi:AcrR family transcriptional regulator
MGNLGTLTAFRNDTRERILYKLADSMHEFGYQGLRTDKVSESLGITKGAFYHYFADKKSAGMAVVDEVMAPEALGRWAQVDKGANIPDNFIKILTELRDSVTEHNVHLGGRLSNLMQEMSSVDEDFRQKLEDLTSQVLNKIASGMQIAADRGEWRSPGNADEDAMFLLISIMGAYSIAKLYRSKKIFDVGLNRLILWVTSWKA